MLEVRLTTDPPAAGAWNMAVDEALLHSAAEDGVTTLRLYRWEEPTLSLGYFQPAAERELHPASLACPLVRRASGGGAIVHDRELTYSLAIPQRDVRSNAATKLYDAVHDTLVETLAALGAAASSFRPPAGACNSGEKQSEPFLCFQRRTCGDIVLDGYKIVGSAQRRRRAAVLQHGSILFSKSDCAPELPGVNDLVSRAIDEQAFAQKWQTKLAARLGWSLDRQSLTAGESALAVQLVGERFRDDNYLYRR